MWFAKFFCYEPPGESESALSVVVSEELELFFSVCSFSSTGIAWTECSIRTELFLGTVGTSSSCDATITRDTAGV